MSALDPLLLFINVFNKLKAPIIIIDQRVFGFLANYPREVAQSLPKDFRAGVYYGWAKVDDDHVHKMVVNIGWCPFYQNKEMSVETHVMHKFDNDFYGSMLKICIVGYLRPEKNFTSLDELIEAIKQDIHNAENNLEETESNKLKSHEFFLV